MPEWMGGLGTRNWAGPISEVAKLAVQTIDGLSEKAEPEHDLPMKRAAMASSEMEWLTRLRWIAAYGNKRGAVPEWVLRNDGEALAEVAKAALKALDLAISMGFWRHKVRGSVYSEVARATISTNGQDEGKRVVVYRSMIYPNEVYVRDEKEFEDGRFERLWVRGGEHVETPSRSE